MTFQAIIYLNFYFDTNLQIFIITPKHKSNTTLKMIKVKYLTEDSAGCGALFGTRNVGIPKEITLDKQVTLPITLSNFLIFATKIILTYFNHLLHSELQRTEFQRFCSHIVPKGNFHSPAKDVHRCKKGMMGKLRTYLFVIKSPSQTRNSKMPVYPLVFCLFQEFEFRSTVMNKSIFFCGCLLGTR